MHLDNLNLEPSNKNVLNFEPANTEKSRYLTDFEEM